MELNYNWYCKVCEAVNERHSSHCSLCGAPRVLTPLHTDILQRAHRGLPPDENMLKEHALQQRVNEMHPVAQSVAGLGMMLFFVGAVIYKVSVTLVALGWGLGFLAFSVLTLWLSRSLERHLNNDSQKSRPSDNTPPEKP